MDHAELHASYLRHLERYSVKRGSFVLKSGATSEWFLDSKQTACRPDGIRLIADLALPRFPSDATAIGGLTMGADPVAFGIAAIAALRGRNLRSFSIRKEMKGYGVGGRIAGALEPGDRVIITEDTSTRGTSAMEAVKVVRDYGAVPVMILTLVDRGGTLTALAEADGIEVVALATAVDLGFAFGS